ncbi:MAG: ASKHA domain-containing protein [Alphaproteobacteria bacterium]|jgi:uncharacterized 2Fe-2S/4Fe-4S cluster protein (DUF4445 family)|nr:ASKHA domain-containing protein [Alphaproteobacteria bacterium]
MSSITHDGESRRVRPGRTIFDYADELALEVPTSCKRNGECHECIVEISAGMAALGPRSEAESFLRGDYRLACQAVIERADADIAFAPLRRRPKILASTPRPAGSVVKPVVRHHDGEVLYDGEVIDHYRGRLLGLAIDLGTTTVVMELVDLETGDSLSTSGFGNPQRFGGSDVMHRISYDRENGEAELQKAIVAAINAEILALVRRLRLARRDIFEIVVAGNATMRDLLFGLDVQPIGQKPYKSEIELDYLAGRRPHTALLAEARELGLRASRGAKVYGLPLVASHVGGDAAADLIAVGMLDGSVETRMLVDIGTNTEVVLSHGGRMLAASCPAGPAFEGGLITYGMPAYEGAIERLSLSADAQTWHYRTIGDGAAEGLCGSALVDALAELRRARLLTEKGVFTHDRKQFETTLVPERGITISKRDIGNLGQAKAANYCGQLILMRMLGIGPADVSRLYLAGGFANYVDVTNAVAIGLLAPVPADRVVKAGNASIRGAREVLLCRETRREVEAKVAGIEHVELETTQDFFDLFVDGCQFRPMPARLSSETAVQTT